MSTLVESIMNDAMHCSFYFFDYDKQYALLFGSKKSLLRFLDSYSRFTDTDIDNYEAIVTLYSECGIFDMRYDKAGELFCERNEIYRIDSNSNIYLFDYWYDDVRIAY